MGDTGDGRRLPSTLVFHHIFLNSQHDWYIHPEPVAIVLPDVTDLDGRNELEIINESVPVVPACPVPGKEVIPQGQGPDSLMSHKPPHPPHHGGWWIHVYTGANVNVTYFPD